MNDKVMLVFAPHPDDEVLGVGGTIAKRAKQGVKVVDCIVTQGKDHWIRKNEALEANHELGISETIFLIYTLIGWTMQYSHKAFWRSLKPTNLLKCSFLILEIYIQTTRHLQLVRWLPLERSTETHLLSHIHTRHYRKQGLITKILRMYLIRMCMLILQVVLRTKSMP